MDIKKQYHALTDEQLLWFWNQNESYPLAKTFLHTHTDLGSPKDSVLTCEQYVDTAKKMGATSISITDHGTLYGVPSLYKLCRKEGIKLIPGCEFYVCEDISNKLKHTRLHLVVYAKDHTGYQAISRLVTESNKRLAVTNKTLSYPCVSKELLTRYIGEAKGHVIGTSACIGGVVLGQIFENDVVQKNIASLTEKVEEIDSTFKAYKSAEETIAQLTEKSKALEGPAKKSYVKKDKAIEKMPEGEEKEAAIKGLEAEKAESAAAAKELAPITIRLKAMTKEVNGFKTRLGKLSGLNKSDEGFGNGVCAYIDNLKKQLEAQKAILDEDKLYSKFQNELTWYDDLFGHGDFYAELQYHGISAEKQYMPVLADIAAQAGIPVVAANDAHMMDKSYAEARNIVTSMRFNKWEPIRPEDTELYLKDDCELFHALTTIVSEDKAFEAMKNREKIADACDVVFEKEAHYPKYKAN